MTEKEKHSVTKTQTVGGRVGEGEGTHTSL